MQVCVDLPEGLLAALKTSPDGLGREVRLAAAVTWYEQGKVSQEIAARVAGLDRTDFLLALVRSGAESFRVDLEDLDRELARG
ncbi:MAG: UPF0175 family protein [Thermodesulfobacteriota bacterium]|jgi:predicted HTH domain antitoxin